MTADLQLSGVRVLLIEDEPLVALGIADQLRAAGATIVGPCSTEPRALHAMQTQEFDVALVDFVLADNNSEHVQIALENRGVPFVVLTAYPPVLVRRYDGQHILQKPADAQLLCATIERLARAGRSA